jgi:hypothetical protein
MAGYSFEDIAADDGSAMAIFCGVGDAENPRGLDPIEVAEFEGAVCSESSGAFDDDEFAEALDFLLWLKTL